MITCWMQAAVPHMGWMQNCFGGPNDFGGPAYGRPLPVAIEQAASPIGWVVASGRLVIP